jgi:hypothetical protein
MKNPGVGPAGDRRRGYRLLSTCMVALQPVVASNAVDQRTVEQLAQPEHALLQIAD